MALSFLNDEIQQPDASRGIMLTATRNMEYLGSRLWLLAPALAIFITVLAFNFLGNRLRDAVDTKTAA